MAAVIATAAIELALGRERRSAAGEARRARGQSIGRAKALKGGGSARHMSASGPKNPLGQKFWNDSSLLSQANLSTFYPLASISTGWSR